MGEPASSCYSDDFTDCTSQSSVHTATTCSKGHGALQNGHCMICRWEKESIADDGCESISSKCSSVSASSKCRYGHGEIGAAGCATCNWIAFREYASSSSSSDCGSSSSGESKRSDDTCSMTSSSDDARSSCSLTSSSGAGSSVEHDAQSTCSRTSSSNNALSDENEGDTCSLTSSNQTGDRSCDGQIKLQIDAKQIRNDWLHRIGDKANMMYLEAFRDALDCPETAGEIAASFLRFHEQARCVEETQNQMLQETLAFLCSSEQQRKDEFESNQISKENMGKEMMKIRSKITELERLFTDEKLIGITIMVTSYPIYHLRMRAYEIIGGCKPYPPWVMDTCLTVPPYILTETPYMKWMTKYHPDVCV